MSKYTTCLALITAWLCLAWPQPSEAHRGDWYWGAGRAELKFETRYDVVYVSCTGYGKRLRGDSGGWLYKHFSCFSENYDGTTEEDELHVLGRRRFVVYD